MIEISEHIVMEKQVRYFGAKFKAFSQACEKSADQSILNDFYKHYWAQIQHSFSWIIAQFAKYPDLDPLRLDFIQDGTYLLETHQSADLRISWFTTGVKIAERNNRQDLVGVFLNNVGHAFLDRGDLDKALEYLDKALVFRQQSNDNSGVASTLVNRGSVFVQKRLFEKGIADHQRALGIWQVSKDLNGQAYALNSLGYAYGEAGDFETGLHFWEEALTIRRELGDFSTMIATLSNIGAIHESVGHLKEATKYLKEALDMTQVYAGDLRATGPLLNNLGTLHIKLNEYEQAKKYFLDSLEVRKVLGDLRGKVAVYANLARVCYLLNDVLSAMAYARDGLTLADRFNPPRRALLNMILGHCYLYNNDASSAYISYCESHRLKTQLPSYPYHDELNIGLIKTVLHMSDFKLNTSELEHYDMIIERLVANVDVDDSLPKIAFLSAIYDLLENQQLASDNPFFQELERLANDLGIDIR